MKRRFKRLTPEQKLFAIRCRERGTPWERIAKTLGVGENQVKRNVPEEFWGLRR